MNATGQAGLPVRPGSRKGRGRERRVLFALFLPVTIGLFGFSGFFIGSHPAEPRERSFTILARQYAYDPPVLHVNRGDTVRLRFGSLDVVHGFYLEGHDLDVTIRPMQTAVEVHRPGHPEEVERVEEVVFTADREGKFRYRCSHTCGFMHPFMLGEMIVGPNRLLPAGMGAGIGTLVGSFLIAWWRKNGA